MCLELATVYSGPRNTDRPGIELWNEINHGFDAAIRKSDVMLRSPRTVKVCNTKAG
jgi:hypothetical protein